ncbi:MAG TPA: sodium:solute symporter family protein [Dyella sp.]|uniref:monocarboxylate uptake permease MctP n=1 Tax=Dyella sp. TaxID=1869338 RepID=UPI002CE310E1|nr:sodium:solute symporter family protein [Dyella sp.]HTV85293.1 sodium:solute symporter family protein [Dyella sp.]
MTTKPDYLAIGIFVAFFVLVVVVGFLASRWKRTSEVTNLHEWGLGGRSFGVWITWFLVGGDFYTAYTIIAVPALVYAVGAYGFFALPYTIIVYPFVFAVMPVLWRAAKQQGHVTAADVVYGHYGSRPLELAVALTAVVATMPYIALQLVGMIAVLSALGLHGEIPLIIAFAVLAVYSFSSGIRGPALIAVLKDVMIYVAVIAAVAVIPSKLGGYGAVFDAADQAFKAKGSGGILLKPAQFVPYATLALGSALAAFMYPHTLTGVFASKSANTVRRNAMLLPAYTLLLGLLALLGYMGHAAHLNVTDNNDVVPELFKALFPSWFAGFTFAAIGIGALVPAAVMSIGAANVFTRNFWRAYVNPAISPEGEASVAKLASLAVQIGALLVILYLPIQFALYLQLLGGMWILQTLPSVVFGLYSQRLRAPELLSGLVAGLASGTWFIWSDGLKPIHHVALGSFSVSLYTGLLALAINLVVLGVVHLARSLGASRAHVSDSVPVRK